MTEASSKGNNVRTAGVHDSVLHRALEHERLHQVSVRLLVSPCHRALLRSLACRCNVYTEKLIPCDQSATNTRAGIVRREAEPTTSTRRWSTTP